MGLAVVHSRTLNGVAAVAVQVEVHLANGLPCLTLVGLADTEVREARERVRSALAHSGLGYPHNQRITVNLAPADVPKDSGRFDLPIALGILAAQGQLDARLLDAHEFAGELSLAGDLRPIQGALALALGLRRTWVDRDGHPPPTPHRRLVLPVGSAQEAALVDDLVVLQAAHLLEVVQALRAEGPVQPLPQAKAPTPTARASWPPTAAPASPASAAWPSSPSAPKCLRDIRGQAEAKRALEISAAGQHSLLLMGPPGSGKSMLAQRLPDLLPPLSHDQALQCAALASVSSAGFHPAQWGQRPWRAPHHSCSTAALIGGGHPPRPGEISLADGGILFLDELPEFSRRTLESLREPLETGQVLLSRGWRQVLFPCRLQLLAAMNPCPCGWLGNRLPSAPQCRCTPDAVLRYRARISGPLLDRLDLRLEVCSTAPSDLLRPPSGDTSREVAQRVAQARDRQQQRQGCTNAELPAQALAGYAPLSGAAAAFLERAAQRLGLTGRSLHRTLRVARTVADLAGADAVDTPHLAEALQLRRGVADAQVQAVGRG